MHREQWTVLLIAVILIPTWLCLGEGLTKAIIGGLAFIYSGFAGGFIMGFDAGELNAKKKNL